jgi:hypothetical protein
MQQYVDAYRSDPVLAQKADQAMQKLLARSATDMDFRQLLLSDSRAALSQHFGHEAPESTNIVFVENRADATVVLPDVIDADAELSQEELEVVAGGIFPVIAGVMVTCAIIAYVTSTEM